MENQRGGGRAERQRPHRVQPDRRGKARAGSSATTGGENYRLELVEVRGWVEGWGEDSDSRTVAGEGQVEGAGDSGLAGAVTIFASRG